MILDVNVLLYAIDERAPQHARCRQWLENAFSGTTRVGLPWPTILAFLRIGTHPRAMTNPMTANQAWSYLDSWLDTPVAWVPEPATKHRQLLRELTTDADLRGNLIPDAHLAALAAEHGVPVVSCDTDFGRFSRIRWINPLDA